MLLKRLIFAKMAEGEDMRSYLADYFDIVGKIEDMDIKIDKQLFSILLLYSIPNSYEPFRVATETKDSVLEPEALKIKLIKEYEARMRKNEEASTMFISRKSAGKLKRQSSNGTAGRNKNTEIKYFKCKKSGHIAKNYRKHEHSKESTSESSNRAEMSVYARANHTAALCDINLKR